MIKRVFDVERKKQISVKIFVLVLWLATLSCKMSNPLSGLTDALKNMFESIARGINISF